MLFDRVDPRASYHQFGSVRMFHDEQLANDIFTRYFSITAWELSKLTSIKVNY